MSYTLINGLLGNSLTKFLADVSYGVYLVHGFFIGTLATHPVTESETTFDMLLWNFEVAFSLLKLLKCCKPFFPSRN